MKPIAIGRDIKLCGALFLLVGLVDVLLIEFYPAYPLKMLGGAVTGPYEYPAKLHSPVVHFLIGYGFLFLRPWGWGLAVAYGTRHHQRTDEPADVWVSCHAHGFCGHHDPLSLLSRPAARGLHGRTLARHR